MLVGRIVIELNLAEDGDLLHTVDVEEVDGETLSMLASLGALEMAKDTLLHGNDD